MLADFCGLIEAALCHSFWMQRHRHDKIRRQQMLRGRVAAQSIRKDISDDPRHISMLVVFEVKNQPSSYRPYGNAMRPPNLGNSPVLLLPPALQGRPAASPTRYGGYNDRINNSCGFDQSDSHSKRSKLPSDTAAAKPPRPSFLQISSYPHTFFLYIFSSQQTRCGKDIDPVADGSGLRLSARRLPSLGHLSCISSAVASGSALKVPRAEALHFLA